MGWTYKKEKIKANAGWEWDREMWEHSNGSHITRTNDGQYYWESAGGGANWAGVCPTLAEAKRNAVPSCKKCKTPLYNPEKK